ncbi:hypothetical protein PTW35_05195 [Photobacterium sp. DA100]|uniref:hypothetical protein n=1 Tax=Photobacterium sp. DA100 TaxID=3027472 RepID=UPI002479433A|nr:hypothetical protein [Photobacterium sp. DA100]WEM43197.1 hypothetical protein PTW35_05195 [Photobacterium sp. DA100]
MMSDTDFAYALKQLQMDKYAAKIPVEEHRDIVEQALALGERVAGAYRHTNFYLAFEQAGYKIEYTRNVEQALKHGLMMRAEIIEDNLGKRVLIYRDSIDQALADLARFGVEASSAMIESLYLAHEFFHMLEMTGQVEDPVLQRKVVRLTLLGKSFFGHLHSPSEIASNRFAHRACQAPFNPLLIDELFIGDESETQ